MRFPRLVYNRLSIAGLAIAVLSFIVFLFLAVLHTFTDAARAPYAGLLIFIVVPTMFFLGLLIVPLGMFFEWVHWRRQGKGSIRRFPIIDLNDPRHLNATLVFAAGTLVVLFVFVFSSYQAYQYTESVAFCGTLCHTVMKPEYTVYHNSPHARVACVECHIGPGAGWFIKSKLSGVPQIFAVIFHTYQKPIQTPVANLRPARETCEQCHWPRAFFGSQQRKEIHFLPDEKNTRWEINLLLKTGGGTPETSRTEGIHWHIDNKVQFLATDQARQVIPWVRVTYSKTGKVKEFSTGGKTLTESQIVGGEVRTMDCIDCHNRPTHIFRSPSDAVNRSLAGGNIDASLPFVKKTAVNLLAGEYGSQSSGVETIEKGMNEFYREKFPDIAKMRAKPIAAAAADVQRIFQQNIFPDMKVRWSTHQDNIGHQLFPGCFRCHDGNHKTSDGELITRNCRACHALMSQGEPGRIVFSSEPEGLTFTHPTDIGTTWKETPCYECHTGVAP